MMTYHINLISIDINYNVINKIYCKFLVENIVVGNIFLIYGIFNHIYNRIKIIKYYIILNITNL